MKKWMIGFVFSALTGNVMNVVAQHKDSTLLDLVTIFPNPYYQSGEYLKYYKDTISINYLPSSANSIHIYTLNGTLVKKFLLNEPHQTIYWNLRDEEDKRIVTGLYLIHIQTPDIGDRTIKFYAFIRQKMSSY